ncbi:MAG TPA: hemerythrin domain-containing protein, partial [Candidatus Binataceae bacterium]|nr:hemerythrin domain-containing protein [Candidatus Binataceae bacterium]
DIGPIEDLMREHGVLRRVLLVYEEGLRRIAARQDFPGNPFLAGAQLIRKFIEDYHEKNEENFIFPKLRKAGGEVSSDVAILLEQHQAGRKLTDEIIRVSTSNAKDNRLVDPVTQFIRMYRPHAAREDTVVFPAFHKTVSDTEFERVGEQMEKQEQRLFGEGGFAKIVEAVAEEERALGIYELDRFTPKVEAD